MENGAYKQNGEWHRKGRKMSDLDISLMNEAKANSKPKSVKTTTPPKKKVVEHKPQGLAGDDKIAQAMAATQQNRKVGKNLIGAAMDSLANM